MSNIHKEIVSNLEGRVYPVNVMTALSGVDFEEGMVALRELQVAGRVRQEYLRGVANGPPMYRLVPTFTPYLVK